MYIQPSPCTLHPTPYTLHPTPRTSNPITSSILTCLTSYPSNLCTLHPTPYTLHPTPCTLHPTPQTRSPPVFSPASYRTPPHLCTLHPKPYTAIPMPRRTISCRRELLTPDKPLTPNPEPETLIPKPEIIHTKHQTCTRKPLRERNERFGTGCGKPMAEATAEAIPEETNKLAPGAVPMQLPRYSGIPLNVA